MCPGLEWSCSCVSMEDCLLWTHQTSLRYRFRDTLVPYDDVSFCWRCCVNVIVLFNGSSVTQSWSFFTFKPNAVSVSVHDSLPANALGLQKWTVWAWDYYMAVIGWCSLINSFWFSSITFFLSTTIIIIISVLCSLLLRWTVSSARSRSCSSVWPSSGGVPVFGAMSSSGLSWVPCLWGLEAMEGSLRMAVLLWRPHGLLEDFQ